MLLLTFEFLIFLLKKKYLKYISCITYRKCLTQIKAGFVKISIDPTASQFHDARFWLRPPQDG